MITTSSMSSTLSPLAPPFTVDNHRYRFPPHPPPSTLPELNRNGSFNAEALPVRSVDKISSWIDPSVHYNALPLSAGHVAENFMAYVDGYGTWHGNHADSTEFQAKIGADSSAFRANAEAGSSAFQAKAEADSSAWEDNHTIYDKQKTDTFNSEYSYFQLPNLDPVVKECHTSNSNSLYDRYISQLVTSPSDSFTYNPPKTCFSSAQIYPPANKASSSRYSIPKNAYSSTLLYEVDDNYLDYMLLNKNPPGSNQYIDNRGDYVKGCITSSENKDYNGVETSSVTAVCSSFGDEVTTDAIHNFSAKHMNIIEPFSSSRTNSAESFDQLNQNEDSPCWKGASRFTECLFDGVDDVNLHVGVNQSESSVGLQQGQNCSSFGAQCIKTSLDVSFSEIDNAKGSECTGVALIIPKRNNGRKDLVTESEAGNIIMTQPIHERTATLSTNGTMLPESSQNKSFDLNFEADDDSKNISFPGAIFDQVSNPVETKVPSATCPKGRKNVMHLVKAMHYISEALLSPSYDSDADGEESDNELIELVITNLESFASRSKKDTVVFTDHTFAGNNFDIKRCHGTAQEVSVADLESDVFDRKENNPQVLLYKNLWMQAEAALCSLKYELEHTRMKLEMESLECGKKVMDPLQGKKSPVRKTQPFDTPEHITPPIACNNIPIQNDAVSINVTKHREQNTNTGESVESSMMARLEILRGRFAQSIDNRNSEQTLHSATETMFKDFADLGFVESRLPQQAVEDGNRDGLNMAPGSFLRKFSNELDVYL